MVNGVNPFFQGGTPGGPAGNSNEQLLLEDLIIESMGIVGFQTYYLPRGLVKEDLLLGEDVLSKFEFALPIEMYLKNTQGYGGDGDFVRAFGIEIRDRATFVVSRRRYEQEVINRNLSLLPTRPAEGDLIYMAATNSLFEIKFVEHENPFYQLGRLYVWELECELFVYSSQKLDTGIEEIDSVVVLQSEESTLYTLLLEDGNSLVQESGSLIISEDFLISTILPGTDNDGLVTESETVMDWTESNPFSD